MKTKKSTILIDCGNTYLKWCCFGVGIDGKLDNEILSEQQSLLHKDASVLETFKDLIDSQAHKCDSIIMVSVLGEVFLAGAKRIAEDAGLSLFEAHSQKTLANIKNAYAQPEKLGSDRLIAMIGAFELIEAGQACIVIDSGTATTIDALDATGQHLGGVIFPGFELSVNSLSSNTELLPTIDFTQQKSGHLIEKNGFATDTQQAIASGCLLSLASAIDGICNKMQRQLEVNSSALSGDISNKVEVKRILCGGVAKTLLPYLENDYDYYENLIMIGLKKIHLNMQIRDKDTASTND